MQKRTPEQKKNRLERINSLLQKLIGEVLPEFLEDAQGLVTVSKVETSGDTKLAKVWISIVGGGDDAILNSINKNIYDIQGAINRQVNLKQVPRLEFFLDTSPRYAQHINELIKKIHEEDES